jgi:hypothetical protein
VLGAFPAEERDADTPAGRALADRGDWRGLKSLESWLQFIRYWGTHVGLRWDYEPRERSVLDSLRLTPVHPAKVKRGQINLKNHEPNSDVRANLPFQYVPTLCLIHNIEETGNHKIQFILYIK